MYYNTGDKHQFLESELSGLREARNSAGNCRDIIRQTWIREECDFSRTIKQSETDYRLSPAYAARERFRRAHQEAAKLKDEVAALEYDLGIEDDEYRDLDEYGYAA